LFLSVRDEDGAVRQPVGEADERGRAGGGPRRVIVGAAVGAVVVLGVAGVLLLARERDSLDTTSSGSTPPETVSGPGTTLPGGLEVAAGSALIGPAVVDEVDGSGQPRSWFAVLQVEDDPITVWTSYVEQIAQFFPEEGIDPAEVPGCMTEDLLPGDPVCRLFADAVEGQERREAGVAMISVPGDVTDSYLLVVHESSSSEYLDDLDQGGGDPWPGGELPEPSQGRPQPEVGEPLAPVTVAYDGDEQKYVLLEGSELVAQYSGGSLTGGFEVLLRTTPGADIGSIGEAYAEQAVQFEGEPIPPPEVVEHDGTTVTVYRPPGGAGGYSGTVWAVDQPSGDDYIFYALIND